MKTYYKQILRRLFLIAYSTFLWCTIAQAQVKEVIKINDDIQLIPLTDSIYVHVSWHPTESFGRVPSNGLIIIKGKEAIMVDTPMDNLKTEQLYLYVQNHLNAKIHTLFIGHFHEDCMGGLEYLQEQNVQSIANQLTVEKCKSLSLPLPSRAFDGQLNYTFKNTPIICRFFGAAHTFDNIAIWLPNEKILFGGCMVKSMSAKGLGNLSDAVVQDWDKTLLSVLEAFPDASTVIPGHGAVGGKELIEHTISLVQQFK